MARKVMKYTIQSDGGRDAGKAFLLTEMPARAGHAWATRALFAVMNSGIEIDDGLLQSGFAGLAAVGIKALSRVPFEVAQPLLHDLLSCVEIMPNADRPEVVRRLIDDDTEEIKTLFALQKEVLSLHMDFFTAAAQSTSA